MAPLSRALLSWHGEDGTEVHLTARTEKHQASWHTCHVVPLMHLYHSFQRKETSSTLLAFDQMK